LSVCGVIRGWNRKTANGMTWLLFLSALTPLVALTTGKSMVYDNERLFMPAFPFIAALAGIGFSWLWNGLQKKLNSSTSILDFLQSWNIIGRSVEKGKVSHSAAMIFLGILLGALLLFPPALAMKNLYPHLLSYYSESIEGLPGATKMGLETTYWCESYKSAVEYITQHARQGDTIWVEWWSEDVLVYYQLHGYLRKDVRIYAADGMTSIFGSRAHLIPGAYQSADWVIFQYRQTNMGEEGVDSSLWKWVLSHEPVYRVEYQGIPIMDLFHK
jgi:hypothetical protein